MVEFTYSLVTLLMVSRIPPAAKDSDFKTNVASDSTSVSGTPMPLHWISSRPPGIRVKQPANG
ncbi:UNVERIFIED_CONTAM: hypothetical protein Sradi_2684500 [Sesamum radiatum]|uniref:Uncharacterized protein n=1 Tax=Sesamum radiatum TaxID=300843 RepID=A0AAW2S7Q1_SESRA